MLSRLKEEVGKPEIIKNILGTPIQMKSLGTVKVIPPRVFVDPQDRELQVSMILKSKEFKNF